MGPVGELRHTGLWMGASRVARSVYSALEQLLQPLLDALQPTLRRGAARAPAGDAHDVVELERARRGDRGARTCADGLALDCERAHSRAGSDCIGSTRARQRTDDAADANADAGEHDQRRAPAGGRKPAARPIAQRVRPPDGAGHDAQLERECADRKRDDGSRRPPRTRTAAGSGSAGALRGPDAGHASDGHGWKRQRRHSGTTARGSIVLPRAAVRRQRAAASARDALAAPRARRAAAARGPAGDADAFGDGRGPRARRRPSGCSGCASRRRGRAGHAGAQGRSGRQGSGTRERFARARWIAAGSAGAAGHALRPRRPLGAGAGTPPAPSWRSGRGDCRRESSPARLLSRAAGCRTGSCASGRCPS